MQKLTQTVTAAVVFLALVGVSFGKSVFPDNKLLLEPKYVPLPRSFELSLQNITQLECTTVDDVGSGSGIFNGLINPIYRWRNFNVFIDPSYNNNERTLFINAMTRLVQAIGCVPFGVFAPGVQPWGDYVHIKKLQGCWSFVGRLGGGQDISLPAGCMSMGTIMHEMIHALGLWHEQNRPDRDNYVIIYPQNIQPGTEHNFNKLGSDYVSNFGVAYNTRSIMHYHSTAFSSNGQPTIVARNGGPVGSTGDLQQTDIDKLRRMYNCN